MGTLKSIEKHKPVLVDEVLEYLDPQPDKVYLDVTFGSGGHTRAILEHEPKCTVIALDWDLTSIEKFGPPLEEEFGDRLTLVWSNFTLIYKIFKKLGIKKVDGILADFGTSQMQIAHSAGFSFQQDTPLDMRMSPAHQKVTAAEVLNRSSREKLEQIFFQLGQERHSKRIVHEIMLVRKQKRFKTTRQLAELIERVVHVKGRPKIHPATRVFQALRIYVNQELTNIEALLQVALKVLNDEGRLVCVSFHSLEDRIVKQFFKNKEREGVLSLLTKRVVVPSAQEIAKNPSSRSSKLRAALFVAHSE